MDNNLSNNKVKAKNSIISNIRFLLEILIPLVGIFFIFDIPLMFFRVSLFEQQYMGIFWALTTALLFLCLPAKRKDPKNNPQWYDLVLAGLALIIGAYILIYYPIVLLQTGIIRPIQFVLGLLVTIVVLETVRRTTGWSVVILVTLFIIYAKFGYLLPGLLGASTLSWSRLFQQLYLGADFMLGTPLRIATGVVFGFIFFGIVLIRLGAAEFLMDICFALFGKVRGGPAKISIASSALFGTISGSAAANVVATGMITIPLMKRTGYPDWYAGAVEAVASTGGQIMPPVMGAAAFVMAELLGIPYARVCILATIPALLYFITLFVQVDSEAIKLHLGGTPKELIKPLMGTLKRGWVYIIPILVLFWSLFIAFQNAGVASLTATGVAILVSLIDKKTRAFWSLKNVVKLMKDISHGMLDIISITAGAGFVIGIIAYTGLGLSFSQLLTQAARGNLILLALLTALASVILGMGMPTTPAYIMLAVLAAPAMVNIGVAPSIAHLFVFYFGTLSMITPPVAMAVFVAASVSGANTLKIAGQAMKLGIAGYIVPFIFLFNPALALVGGTTAMKLVVILFTILAVYLIGISFAGYAVNNKLSIIERILLGIIAFVLIFPNPEMGNQSLMAIKIVGSALAFFFIFSLGRKNKILLKTKTA